MALFEGHIHQAKRNLTVLGQLNGKIHDCLDWQVTVAFYTALHLVNSYLAKEADLHYKTHHEVDTVINPKGDSPYKLNEPEYLAYEKLKNLSRRSRYMCHDDVKSDNPRHGFVTEEKHLYKAIKQLDKLVTHFNNKYSLGLGKINISCKEFSASDKFNHITTPTTA